MIRKRSLISSLYFANDNYILSFALSFMLIPLPETEGSQSGHFAFLHAVYSDYPHTEQKNLQFYFCFSAWQKSLEFIIIFKTPNDPSI